MDDLLSVVEVSPVAPLPSEGRAFHSSCHPGPFCERCGYAWGSREPSENALGLGALTEARCEVDRFVWIWDKIEQLRKFRLLQLGLSTPFFRDGAQRDAFIEHRIGGS